MAKSRHEPPLPLLVALCLCCLVSLLLLGLLWQHVTKWAIQRQPGRYEVLRVSDGDTLVVAMEGRRETIRMIGVDTPEVHKPGTPVQCYGPDASEATKRFIGSSRIRLSADPLSTNRDRYDRLLRYVHLKDGRMLNELLIREGYGFYYPYFPYTKSAAFQKSEQIARHRQSGVWKHCSPVPTDGGGHITNALLQ